MGRLGANRRSIEGHAGTSRSELPACERQGSGFAFTHDLGLPKALGSEIEPLHGVILDLWVNILSWRVILQIFSNLACDRLISDPGAASSPYHGRAYHDRGVARAVAPLEN